MKKLKLFGVICILALFFSSNHANAQEDTLLVPMETKPQFGFSTGVSVFSSGRYGGGFTRFVSPVAYYQLHPKINFSVGANISNTDFKWNSKYRGESNLANNMDLSTNRIFSNAVFMVSPRVAISGGVYYEYNMMSPIVKNGNQTEFDNMGFHMNLNYRITNNSSFGISVDMNKGNYLYNPLLYDGYGIGRGVHPFSPQQDPFNQLDWPGR